MLIDAIAKTINESGAVEKFWSKLDSNEDAALGIVSSARPLFVASRFALNPCPTLVVIPGNDAAYSFARTLASFLGEENIALFPDRKDRPYLDEASDPSVVAKRLYASHILKTAQNKIVVASARSLVRALPPADSNAECPIVLEVSKSLEEMEGVLVDDVDSLKSLFESVGYENTVDVEGPGTFGMRGGAIDIFPANLDHPVHLDFFGDDLDEIRRMVPSTRQLVSNLERVEIFPVTEVPLNSATFKRVRKKLEMPALTNKALRSVYEKLEGGLRFDGFEVIAPFVYDNVVSIGDYLSSNTLVSLIEPRAIFDDMQNAYEEFASDIKGSGFEQSSFYLSPAEVNLSKALHATYSSIMQLGSKLDDEVPVKRVDVARSESRLYSKLRDWVIGNYMCLFSIASARARGDIELALVDESLPIQERLDALDPNDFPLERGVVNIVDVDIPLGIVIPKAKLAMLSLDDLKGAKRSSHPATRINSTDITFPYTAGDYVVHELYGIARFKGLVRRDLGGVERDYLELDYAQDDKLFLPVEQFDKVTRYVGAKGVEPKITRLDSTDWSRAVSKARKATRKMAFDLVEVYSRRNAAKGYRFEVETPWLREMEDAFPYEETPDQKAAISDIKADMRSEHPMDRLVCGDVGFGKTEIAIRAAFIAAQNKKQVMVLCPTTILTQQHASSFKQRLEPFGMRVEALSRFRSAAEQKIVLEDFASGKVNVLIGTHRLLSRDIEPNDLGLVIIDEEQRFGVAHKEQFKNMREHIDILTLSATPIPRTMQMAVSGVRDMSLILTPPADRLPVNVHVGEWDPDIISDAIRRELARDGQIYYVSNRVRTIEDAKDRVLEIAPEARVGLAHGQMSKDELERVMEDFAAGLYDILVATTIIESGIDNPNTNTLVIEDAQRLGLSQMYQLKGRVGRSARQAYAYFMFPEEIPLTEDTMARLTALSENQGLGSGMRIALKDLEIRGAGSLLGAEQSGNMSAVGFDLFAQMLNSAVMEVREGLDVAKSDVPENASDVNINIPGKMYLSDDYIEKLDERILWYRRITSCSSIDELDNLELDLRRIYPDMPIEAQAFFSKEKIRIAAVSRNIKTISVAGGNLTIEGILLGREQLIWLKRHGGRYLSDKRKLIFPIKKLAALDESLEDDIAAQIVYLFSELYNVHSDKNNNSSDDLDD